ncbi:DUF6193 family natural product biosynthesis protein [Streptomyces sp. A012304]|uniref:DUF6193 family natural product biosynthesis protein n=1 Tax=Streptomyces sp. A012304 TaxID=375446 RepID=UPI00222EC965|nr:DUF6193 family natural product biosynthesis protein [Streptomyces sp. A012304]GKQ41781.1 hypothetical protein ALMP_82940 [Streptomyces sp. A012304]
MTRNEQADVTLAEKRPDDRLYPDLFSGNGLAERMRTRSKELGTPLASVRAPEGRQRQLYATVPASGGDLQISLGGARRVFLARIWSRGVELAGGKSEDLDEVIAAASLWASGARLRELGARYPFMEIGEISEAYEEGREVEAKWALLLRSDQAEARRLAEEALRFPKLAGLFPYLSHHDLLLSRTTGYPFTRDAPCIRPLLSGGYVVMWPETMETIATVESPRQAVEIVNAALPEQYGPAVPGTADDLGAA